MSTPRHDGIFFNISLAELLRQRKAALKHNSARLPALSLEARKANKSALEKTQSSLLGSQAILFKSRWKWGVLYSLATVVGLFAISGFPGVLSTESATLFLLQRIIPAPIISLLIATGMYILNDLIDADLDRANGKKRPIPSGKVSKQQAWTFVLTTNGIAVILAAATFNVATMLLIVPMLLIGILYSAPRVKLMNRFVVKTLAIASFYVLCAVLGMTSIYGMDQVVANPAPALHAMMLLGIMIFISSTLNDLGDVAGDKAAGRRTIPIVMGGVDTIRLLIALAAAMIALSWMVYGLVNAAVIISSSVFFAFVISRLQQIKQSLKSIDAELARAQHRKIFPLHMVLQAILCAGAFLTPI
jgi:geranylgeranylglycerol-phosphate geranylgeranyltransferase